jgi:hypothetical protein
MCFPHYQLTDHPLKTIWKNIRSRHPNGYPAAWQRFDSFLAEVGDRPTEKHQLRRIDPTLPFSKENAAWLPPVSADRNKHWTVEERADYMREWNFKKSYGITSADYDRMFAEQGGRCAICLKSEDDIVGVRGLVVDHDHTKGEVRKSPDPKAVRGLLCVSCNRGVGYLCDDPALLRAAAAYLERRVAAS